MMKKKTANLGLLVILCLLITGCGTTFSLNTNIFGKEIKETNGRFFVIENKALKEIQIKKNFEPCNIIAAKMNSNGMTAFFVIYSSRTERLKAFTNPWKGNINRYLVFVGKENKIKYYKLKWSEKLGQLAPYSMLWKGTHLIVNISSDNEFIFNEEANLIEGKELID